MNENPDPNAGLTPRDQQGNYYPRPRPYRTNGHDQHTNHYTNGHSTKSAFDFWTVADILAQRWHWPAIAGTLGMVCFLALGWKLIQPSFTALVELRRYETPGISEFLKTTPLSSETFAALMAAPDLMQRVGSQVQPPIPPEKLVKMIKVEPQVESDMVKVQVGSRFPQDAVALANLYATEAVAYTKQLQADQAGEVANTYLKEQLTRMDQDLKEIQNKFQTMPMSSQVTNKVAQVSSDVSALGRTLANSASSPMMIGKKVEQLQTAIADLNQMTAKFTDLYPGVIQQRALVQSLQSEIEQAAAVNPNGAIGVTPGGEVVQPDLEVVRARLRSLEDARVEMKNRQHEAALLAANPPGVVSVFAPATMKTIEGNKRWLIIGVIAAVGGVLGTAFGFLVLLLAEATDKRLRTADDVKRVTHLPVLTTLGDLHGMGDEARTQWAFRTWTMLQGRLSRSQNHGLVCGVVSSTEGEGRSTWISLMAEAASLAGFRVLTIATQRSPASTETPDELIEGTEGTHDPDPGMNTHSEHNHTGALTSNVLASPAQVTEQLTRPNSQPVVHIPLPGWVWNLERRKQWREALQQWRKIDNLVIFVELPPASVPESVLLGSNLPNLIWLADSGTAEAAETRTQLETLRSARCNLVGAVLNREPARSVKTRFPRWFGCLALLAALGTGNTFAQDTNQAGNLPLPVDPPPGTVQPNEPVRTVAFSAVSRPPVTRAAWQQRLTLGAGDVINIGLFGEPEVARSEVTIAPDGRVSYLEANDVLVTGLTVDELRQKLDEELGKYRRAVRTIVTPVAYKSKKYFVLGQVVQRGVYTLERPITVIEAIARAQGFINGQVDYNTVDLADLQRSFLMRNGKRIAIDFEKLFQHGDLSQNVPIEPGDYLYFPSGDLNQIYVLGEVATPGAIIFRPGLTAVGGISAGGGFTEAAYKSKVLVVRGSLNRPETFVVNVWDITKGRENDFQLQPKDIIYVTWRPFYRAEELLDQATMAFIASAVSAAVGVHVLEP